MIYDIHAHVMGLQSGEEGNFLCPPERRCRMLAVLLRRVVNQVPCNDGESLDMALQRRVLTWIGESQVDRVVLLALDGVFTRDGHADLERTQIIVGNDFVARLTAGSPKALLGASIHPYRRDARAELDRVVERGACLIKWLPSAQNIAPDDPLCIPFYERMAHHGIPLLTHTGIEHTLPVFGNALNDPQRLVPALERGVTVIAAHCGTRMYLHERSHFGPWRGMARKYPTFYGDLSAFGLPVHGQPMRRILGDPVLLSKVVHGSDFPTPSMPLWYVFRLGWRKAVALHTIANPFDKAFATMKELGVPDTVFSRVGTLLRRPVTAGPAVTNAVEI